MATEQTPIILGKNTVTLTEAIKDLRIIGSVTFVFDGELLRVTGAASPDNEGDSATGDKESEE